MRLKRCILILLIAAAVALAAMVLVSWGAEPAMVRVDEYFGYHPAAPIWSPGLVTLFARAVGGTAFLLCITLAIETTTPRRRRGW
jgi:hypothetical protein